MKQKSRVPKPRKPTLAHMFSDLVRLRKAMEHLEGLRKKVRLAEAANVALASAVRVLVNPR